MFNSCPSGLGGAGCAAAGLVVSLSRFGPVDLLCHSQISVAALEAYTGTRLRDCTIRVVPCAPIGGSKSDFLQWSDLASSGYDLFVALCHDTPPWCFAERGALFALFPWSPPDRLAPWHASAVSSYCAVLSNSFYTRHWLRRRWGTDSTVLYPPVRLVPPHRTQKQRLILSVGRFSGRGLCKAQVDLIRAFQKSTRVELAGWRVGCVGGSGSSAEDQEYLNAALSAARASASTLVETDLSRQSLDAWYGAASVYWHAAGLGVDEESNPELAEHFGITTVEAMSAGCVPVVLGSGGQRELVVDSECGMVCSTLDELLERTASLASNGPLFLRLQQGAMRRARDFSAEQFDNAVEDLVRSISV